MQVHGQPSPAQMYKNTTPNKKGGHKKTLSFSAGTGCRRTHWVWTSSCVIHKKKTS